MTERFCLTCKHVKTMPSGIGWPKCLRRIIDIDQVDGSITYARCDRERVGPAWFGSCGYKGKYWEPKDAVL